MAHFLMLLFMFVEEVVKDGVEAIEDGLDLLWFKVLHELSSKGVVEFYQMRDEFEVGDDPFLHEFLRLVHGAELFVECVDDHLLFFDPREEVFLLLFFHLIIIMGWNDSIKYNTLTHI